MLCDRTGGSADLGQVEVELFSDAGLRLGKVIHAAAEMVENERIDLNDPPIGVGRLEDVEYTLVFVTLPFGQTGFPDFR